MITPSELNPNNKVNEAAPSPIGFKNIPSVESPVTLKLDGVIPSWVHGVMYRSGIDTFQMFYGNNYEAHNALIQDRVDTIFC